MFSRSIAQKRNGSLQSEVQFIFSEDFPIKRTRNFWHTTVGEAHMKRNTQSFTLIELLIVVAIIGILAAIAVPNFMNARIRAKIAKVHAELRTLTIACDNYKLDNRVYPTLTVGGPQEWMREQLLIELTTPISYLGSGMSLRDPFGNVSGYYYYIPLRFYYPLSPDGIIVTSLGPDSTSQGLDHLPTIMRTSITATSTRFSVREALSYVFLGMAMVYMPTNGLRSYGDIGRVSGEAFGLPTQIGG